MPIQLQNVMHKMLKVSDFKNEHLLRCFFVGKTLLTCLICFGLFPFVTVLADSDGSLKLNTDVLTKNQVQLGGAGDFLIRGELFSTDLSERSQNKKNLEMSRINQVKTLDFSIRNKDSSGKHDVRQQLFEHYLPQVIKSRQSDHIKQSSVLFWLTVFSVPCLCLVGIGGGRWRVRYKRKKAKARREDG